MTSRGALGLAYISLAIALGGLIFFSQGIEYSNPPRFNSTWNISWGMSILATILALIASSLRKAPANQIVCFLAIGAGLLGSWCPTASFYGNYGTYPWLVLGTLAGLSTVGAFACRLKTMAILSTLFLGIWFIPAFLPSNFSFPAIREARDLECKLVSMDSDGRPTVNFELRSQAGQELANLVDHTHIEVEGQIGPLIHVEGWPATTVGQDDFTEVPRGSRWKLQAQIFPPAWAQSFDLRVIVQGWAEKPDAELVVSLDELTKEPLKVKNGVFRLASAGFRRGKSNSLPPMPCVHVDVTYDEPDNSGFTGGEVRVIDDLDHVVSDLCGSVLGSDEGTVLSLDLVHLDPKAKFLRIQYFGNKARERARTTFTFGGLPTPQRASP